MSTYLRPSELIRKRFEQIQERNPSYSIRSFARDLSLSPSYISRMFRGQTGISSDLVEKISQRLGFDRSEKDYLCLLSAFYSGRSQSEREQAKESLQKIPNPFWKPIYIDDTDFSSINSWYHYPILEACKILQEEATVKSIADYLELEEREAKRGVSSLVNLGFLEEQEEKIIASEKYLVADGKKASVNRRKYHEDILQKASDELWLQEMDKKVYRSVTFSLGLESFKELREKILNFEKEVLGFLEQKNLEEQKLEKKDIYIFSSQLFRVSKENAY